MTTPIEQTSTGADFPQLDAIRLIAAISVVATHTAFWAGAYKETLIGNAAQRLEVGVAVFFVLSGFLLGRPYIASTLTNTMSHLPWRGYFRRRALRILPVYMLTVTAAFILLRENHHLGLWRWFTNLVLIDNYLYRELPRGLSQMWSLTVEITFYTLIPLIGWFLIRTCRGNVRGILLVLAGGIVFSGAWVAATHVTDANWGLWLGRWVFSYLTWFCLGLGLATVELARHTDGWCRRLSSFARDRVSCWILAAAIFFIISTPLGGVPFLVDVETSEALVRHFGYAAVAILFVAPCVLGSKTDRVSRALGHRAVRRVGQLSYGVFCCHMLLIELIVAALELELFNFSWLGLFVLVMITSFMVAELLYRWVERPAIRYGRRLDRRSATKVPASSHPGRESA